MVYGDKFFVGAANGVVLLALYVNPLESLQRLLLIPDKLSIESWRLLKFKSTSISIKRYITS